MNTGPLVAEARDRGATGRCEHTRGGEVDRQFSLGAEGRPVRRDDSVDVRAGAEHDDRTVGTSKGFGHGIFKFRLGDLLACVVHPESRALHQQGVNIVWRCRDEAVEAAVLAAVPAEVAGLGHPTTTGLDPKGIRIETGVSPQIRGDREWTDLEHLEVSQVPLLRRSRPGPQNSSARRMSAALSPIHTGITAHSRGTRPQ